MDRTGTIVRGEKWMGAGRGGVEMPLGFCGWCGVGA